MLTYVTKSNAQRNGMVMWDEVMNEVAQDFPDVTLDHMLGTLKSKLFPHLSAPLFVSVFVADRLLSSFATLATLSLLLLQFYRVLLVWFCCMQWMR